MKKYLWIFFGSFFNLIANNKEQEIDYNLMHTTIPIQATNLEFNINKNNILSSYQTTEQKKLACFLLLAGIAYYFKDPNKAFYEQYYLTIANATCFEPIFLMMQIHTNKDDIGHATLESSINQFFHETLEWFINKFFVVKLLCICTYASCHVFNQTKNSMLHFLYATFYFFITWNSYKLNNKILKYKHSKQD